VNFNEESGHQRGSHFMTELRRHPRVAFQSHIRIKVAGQPQSVPAQVADLSPLGAHVTTSPQDAPVEGAEVTCRFAMASQGRFMRGRVAWVRPSARRVTAGIEFKGLDEEDRALLRRLVEPASTTGQAADVWFEGMSAPVRCHAVPLGAGRGVRLTARLPFLCGGASVRVALSDRPGDGPRDAQLRSAFLVPGDEGEPELRLELALPVLSSVHGTIQVSAAPRTPDPERPATTLVLDPSLDAPAEPRRATPSPGPSVGWRARLAAGWWRVLLGALAGAAVMAALLRLRR
jgi:hypothetical protein